MQRQRWQDAYDTQLALWRWLDTKHGFAWLQSKYHYEVERDEGLSDDMKELMLDIYSVEYGKLRQATTFYVSEEMCEVVGAAKQSFKPEPIIPSDFLAPSGFLYFEQPFEINDRYGRPVQLAGFSWSPMLTADERGVIQSRWWEDKGKEMEFLAEHHQQTNEEGSVGDGMALCLYAVTEHWDEKLEGPKPPLLSTHFTPWWFEMAFEGNETDTHNVPTGAEQWWKVIQTTLRLMQQRLSVRHEQRPTRPQRRESKRVGFGGSDIVVVRLRREKSETAEGHVPSDANYSHRFFVGAATGGFWRDQWYPSIQGHRQIWIAPFIKGDENLPLVIKPRRVFSWTK